MATLSLNPQVTLYAYRCEMEWALRMSLSSHPELAINSARLALSLALTLRRPDLAFEANEVLCALESC
jgi:hypothetical protein